MTRALVAHAQPSISFTITVNIHADKTLLLLFGVVWLAWVGLVRVGRFLHHLYEVGRAVVVVAWRRIRRALRQAERRFSWELGGLVYGPCLGVG